MRKQNLFGVLTFCLTAGPVVAQEAGPEAVLRGMKKFFAATARPDGSYQAGVDPNYPGISDSAFSDLAPTVYAVILHKTFGWDLPHEEKTAAFLLGRQGKDGAFFNVEGTVDPKSALARAYNTTQGLVALRALGRKPRYDPLPIFEVVLREDYKKLPLYMTSFFPLAYLAAGKEIPPEADRKIRAMMHQESDGYIGEHIASTFHAAHYYRLIGEKTPLADRIVARVLRDQHRNGSWFLNPPSRDRHATFDVIFTLRHLGGGRAEVKQALARATDWVLRCRNADGGFGHYPGSTSDMDAAYFQVGSLVMMGNLRPVEPLPAGAHLLGWGHLMAPPR